MLLNANFLILLKLIFRILKENLCVTIKFFIMCLHSILTINDLTHSIYGFKL
jgi:hypothetical protein